MTWRVGKHYQVHVYDGEVPVATFHTVANAERAVRAVNKAADIRQDWDAGFVAVRDQRDLARDERDDARAWCSNYRLEISVLNGKVCHARATCYFVCEETSVSDKMCNEHKEKLHDAVRAHGMDDEPVAEGISPSAAVHWAIVDNLAREGGAGVIVAEGCPLCLANQGHNSACVDSTCTWTYDSWIEDAAIGVASVWRKAKGL